ncbi:MAG TPA: dihydropteroate synthase [Saprospiraceae bacterium]|nr:dihydropteroate synthase [Saprospiraceae bacterium]
MFHEPTTLNCKGQLLMLDQPVVMGILNVTPDSFSDGGQFVDIHNAFAQAEKMIKEGAQIIDVGGMSSRPGAPIISVDEEIQRVIPIIQKIHEAYPQTILSIDTVHGLVAEKAIAAGASIVNDISAWSIDPGLLDVVVKHRVPYVLMHMRGKPENMQDQPAYENVALEVLDFLIEKITFLRKQGLVDIIIDPGFGFGKTLTQNYDLLNRLHTFKMLEAPILAGISRKSMIYKLLETSPKEALTGTIALNWVALEQGAKILRVHDVQEAKEIIEVFLKIQATKPNGHGPF